MSRKYQVISADGHVETPPESWVKYVPEQYQHRAPRLIKLPEGGEGWVVEGQPLLHNGQNITGGKPVKYRNDSYYNADGSAAPGAGDAKQRLHEQDIDGIDAEILFPPVFANRFIRGIADKKAYISMVQAYNTFLAQDYCSVAPDRLFGNGVIPVTGDVSDAINEMRRCASLGLKTMDSLFPTGQFAEDIKFYEASMDAGMRVSTHGGGAWVVPPVNQGGRGGVGTGDIDLFGAIAQGADKLARVAWLIADGTFDALPEFKVYFAETNASWMPSAMFFMDDRWQISKNWFSSRTLKMQPSEYLRKHCLFSFIRDPLVTKMLDILPWQNLMWGTDFPHSVGSFPESRKFLEGMFKDTPEPVRRRMLLELPAEFMGLDLEKDITPTPA